MSKSPGARALMAEALGEAEFWLCVCAWFRRPRSADGAAPRRPRGPDPPAWPVTVLEWYLAPHAAAAVASSAAAEWKILNYLK